MPAWISPRKTSLICLLPVHHDGAGWQDRGIEFVKCHQA
jgi:hypothetical protein